MKRIIPCFLLLAICVSLNLNNIFAQGLNSIHTPDGTNIIAVGNAGKIMRSTNAGATWASYTYTTENFKSVFSLNNDVWIAGENGNIHKTAKTNSPITAYNVGESFTINSICFESSDLGFLCGDNGKVYKSENGGQTWTPINTGIANVKLNSIACLDDQKLIVAGNEGALYSSANRGSSWTTEASGTTKNLLSAEYFDGGIVVTGEYGTILTKEGQNNWSAVSSRTDSDIRGISGTSFTNVHICGGGGFIRNNATGSSFYTFETNPMLANLSDIFYYDQNTGFAVSSLNYAIIRTVNGGTSWELPAGTTISMNWVQKNPSGSGIGNNLCRHPKVRDTYYVVYGNKVYVSRNKGESWEQIAVISVGTRAHSFYVSSADTMVWLAAMESSPDCVARSTDYGNTWTNILARNFSSYGQPLEQDQNTPGTFYFAPDGASTGFFKSTDNGATFVNISTTSNPFTSPCDIIVEWDNSNTLFIGDDGADIYKSTDGGVSWVNVKPTSSSEVPSMCNSVFDTKICYATTWSSSQVFKTVNNGDTWNITSNNSGSGWGSDLCHEDPTVVLTGNYGSQSYLTTNGGSSFSNVNSGLSGAGAGIMVPDRGTFLNMQTGSLFKLNILYSVLTSANEVTMSLEVPNSYDLQQNYPNPFNPATNIKFALPTSTNVSLKVFDQLGKEVETLVNGFRAAGTYEINFDASRLTSGIYFYKLVTNDFASTRKMMLLK